MEFWLWSEIPAPPPERPLQPPCSVAYNGLGLRPLGFKPTRADYEDYVERRNAFLRSPRGRAARFAGGIVGRLAREVDIDDSLPIPDETFENGVCVWDGESPVAYRDISITTHEMDLICGVYFLPTADGLEKKLISWWPIPAIFHHSGLNVGWWTPDCEQWFQATLKEMEDPETPYSVGLRRDWKRKIRFQPLQGSRTVWIMSERIADQYLTRRAQDGHNAHQKER
ncbi:hypothetical protein DFH06DRAFT_976113 [Mycena polygramma]|nr:hypothetical protein DFH06DRAFT_976113 [Mycena polygramma]